MHQPKIKKQTIVEPCLFRTAASSVMKCLCNKDHLFAVEIQICRVPCLFSTHQTKSVGHLNRN